MKRALQTPTREQVQQDADKATYERRAVAVEHERAISENQLQSKIELAIRGAIGRAARRERATPHHRASGRAARTATGAEAERTRVTAQALADRTRLVGAAEA